MPMNPRMRVIVIEPSYDRWRRTWTVLGPLFGPCLLRVRTVADAADMSRKRSPDLIVVTRGEGEEPLPEALVWSRTLPSRPPVVVLSGEREKAPSPDAARLRGVALWMPLNREAPERIAEVLIRHLHHNDAVEEPPMDETLQGMKPALRRNTG